MFLEVDDLRLRDASHALEDGLDDLLVVDFASEPLEVDLFVFFLDCQLDLPERFRNEFFYLLSLINTEAQRRRLTRSVCNWNLTSTASTAERLL